MRKGSHILASLAALVVLQIAGGFSARSEILSTHIRALQTGAARDFSSLPKSNTELMRRLQPKLAPSRRELLATQVEPKMTAADPIPGVKDVVKITFKTGENFDGLCSGFLFAREIEEIQGLALVLTAGHCSCGRPGSYRFFRDTDKEFFVPAAAPIRYADYSCLFPPESQPGRDLALMWIRKPVDSIADSNKANNPLEILPSPVVATMQQIYQDTETKRLVGMGYGLDETGKAPTVALAAAIPIQSFFCASARFADSACASFREFVLADLSSGPGTNRPDSCGGDSGAPIFWVPSLATLARQLNPQTFRVLVGITSRALGGVRHNPGTKCGGGGVYTAIGHPDVVQWLSSNGVVVRGIIR